MKWRFKHAKNVNKIELRIWYDMKMYVSNLSLVWTMTPDWLTAINQGQFSLHPREIVIRFYWINFKFRRNSTTSLNQLFYHDSLTSHSSRFVLIAACFISFPGWLDIYLDLRESRDFIPILPRKYAKLSRAITTRVEFIRSVSSCPRYLFSFSCLGKVI